MILTPAELNALRACIEVAEPAEEDTGPFELWNLAIDALAKLQAEISSVEHEQVLAIDCARCGNGQVGHFGECSNCGDLS